MCILSTLAEVKQMVRGAWVAQSKLPVDISRFDEQIDRQGYIDEQIDRQRHIDVLTNRHN